MRAPCNLLILLTHLAFRQIWESKSGGLLLQLTPRSAFFGGRDSYRAGRSADGD